MAWLSFLFFVLFFAKQADSCTTAIVSGKHTPDGRPLLWKHRDTGSPQNKIMFFSDGKYNYLGLINTKDKDGKQVWAGTNSVGFAIMNSASYNLQAKSDTTSVMDYEGIVMKKALQNCRNLADFEKMLDTLSRPMRVEANFGVIDAEGGAAYYEVHNFGYTKIDVNDPKISPFGYVIRTNYSFTGRQEDGYGYIRYLTAENLFYEAAAKNGLTVRFIFQSVSRSLNHSLLNTDLRDAVPENANETHFVWFQDFIPRYTSSASVVVQGVKTGESPEFTTMWTVLGFPLCSVAVPLWVEGGDNLPAIHIPDESGFAPLSDMAIRLKHRCFPITRGSGKKYMNLNALINSENSGIMQKIIPIENKLFDESEVRLKQWRKNGIKPKSIHEFYDRANQLVLSAYKKEFGF